MKRILIILTTIFLIGCEEEPIKYTLTVSSNPTEGGTINPTSGEYQEGTEVTLRVNTNTNYEFDKWSGSWSGSESPLTITMDSDKNIVGNFKLMDSDGDGVTDDIDLCNSTPSGQTVDSNGCSDSQKDTDGDGVSDDVDTCPDTPSGETVDSNGCSDSQKDTDGDGVSDDVDTCSDTPSGESVDENGCSDSQKDTDGDGVTDDLDTCSETPEGEGVDENGCSDSQKDTDGDGVTDDIDTCPDTPSGEEVNETGCSSSQVDTDGDGVSDDVDLCNSTITGRPVNEWGCQNPIYLDDNGVTIKSYDWGEVGDLGKVDDTYYIVVGDSMVGRERQEFLLSNYIIPYLWLKDGMSSFYSPLFFPIQRGNYRKYKPCTSKLTKEGLRRFHDYFTGPPNSNTSYDLSHWDVSQITDMSSVFQGKYMVSGSIKFLNYGDLSNWDVSNVTNMERMFSNNLGNGNWFSNETMNSLSDWDVSNVTNMTQMFWGLGNNFNVDLSSWDVSNVTQCGGFTSYESQVWTLPKPNFTNCDPN